MKKKVILFLMLLQCAINLQAQSTVMEIRWNDGTLNYTGLVVLHPNNTGVFKVKYYHPAFGWVWCLQDARYSSTKDIYGGVTSYINCSNPRCPQPYAPDVFVIYPNGQMFSQDAAGRWTTRINATIIQPAYWPAKMREYGL